MPAETGNDVVDALRRFADLLAGAEKHLNSLNVFPVADRDTGTNLVRTIDHLLAELDEPSAVDAVTTGTATLGPRVARAALSAARGNSGLICAQYVAGFTEVMLSVDELDGVVLGRAMAAAACSARSAVSRPVEGTMLTVADAAAEACAAAASEPLPVAEVAVIVHARSLVALEKTTEQLDVLAEAGVVDAGAAGLVLFFEALAAALGRLPAGAGVRHGHTEAAAGSPGPSGSGAQPRFVGFELQFTAEGSPVLAGELRALLDACATDVVVSWAGGVVRAHAHLDDPGSAIEAVLDHARPRNIVVEALMESTEP